MHEPMIENKAARNLTCDVRAVSVIEFALSLPLFLLLIMGGMETVNFVLTQHKLAAVASEVASNAARGDRQIDETDISQIMTGARLATQSSAILDNGRIVLSSVRLNLSGNGQWIEWQRCEGGDRTVMSVYGPEGTGQNDSTLQQVGPAPGIKAIDGVNVMVVEARTLYKPIIGNAFTTIIGSGVMRSTTAHVVRDRTTYAIKNDTKLSSSKIKSC